MNGGAGADGGADVGDRPPDGAPDPARQPGLWPSGTSVAFVLLIVLMTLSGVFVGNWLWLSAPDASEGQVFAPAGWLLGVPALILVATAMMALTEPYRIVRRRNLVLVPPESPAAILFRTVAQECGIQPVPHLVHDPRDDGRSARAFGRPGHYYVLCSPAIQSLARRRSATFEMLVRHELSHIQSRDVLMATYAFNAWYAVLAALAAPLLLRAVDPDLSMAPEYLARAGVLAVVVYAVRAQLLRLREHVADIRATPGEDAAREFVRSLSVNAVPPARARRLRGPGWLALHPTIAQRIAVVEDHSALARPRATTFLWGGYAVGAGVPLLKEVVFAVNTQAVAAEHTARIVLYGLLGVLIATEVVRAAGDRTPPSPRSVFWPAVALVCGAALGAFTSFGGTGLVGFSAEFVVAAGVTAVYPATLLLLQVDVVSGSRPWRGGMGAGHPARAAWMLASAVLVAAQASALVPVSELAASGTDGFVISHLVESLSSTNGAAALAIATPVLAVLVTPRASWRAVTVAGLVGGALATVSVLVLWLRLGRLGSTDVVWAFQQRSLWLTVTAAVGTATYTTLRRGAAAGVVSASLVTMIGLGGFAVVAGGAAIDVAVAVLPWLMLQWASVACALVLPVLALTSLLRPAQGNRDRGRAVAPVTGRRIARVALVGLVLSYWLAAATVVAGSITSADRPPVSRLASYLSAELPLLQILRDNALYAAQAASVTAQAGDQIRQKAIPQYDRALEQAREIETSFGTRQAPEVDDLHQAYVSCVDAERTAWEAIAEAIDDPSLQKESQRDAALRDARAALAGFLQLRDAAAVKAG